MKEMKFEKKININYNFTLKIFLNTKRLSEDK